MSFRYPNNPNTHKKRANALKKTKTCAYVDDACSLRNKQNFATINEKENHYSRKNEGPVL